MTEIKDVADFKEILKKENWKIFGIGGLPETRSEASFSADDFEIICSRATGELASVEESIKVKVFNVKNDSKKVENILSEKSVQDYINSFASKKKIAIYIFISSTEIERICQENNWKLIASKSSFFERLNSKDFFFKLLEKIGSSRKFEILESTQLRTEKERLFVKFGSKFVLQTFDGGGGRGTFFAMNDNYEKIIKELNIEGSQKILVSSFVEGADIAVTGCVTRNNGIISGFSRYQFVGTEAIVSGKENAQHSFCGNDWTLNNDYVDSIQKQSENFVQKIGKILKENGYVGIFGVDFIYDEKRDKLVPLEVNPRLIGSYPIEAQFEVYNNEVPLCGFHILDFLNLDYKIYKNMKTRDRKELKNHCSHVVLSNFFKKDLIFEEGMRGGVYNLKKGKINFLRKGFQLSDIEDNETEFILTAGVPKKGYPYKKNNQLMRIIWGRSIKVNNGADIDDRSKTVITAVRRNVENLNIS